MTLKRFVLLSIKYDLSLNCAQVILRCLLCHLQAIRLAMSMQYWLQVIIYFVAAKTACIVFFVYRFRSIYQAIWVKKHKIKYLILTITIWKRNSAISVRWVHICSLICTHLTEMMTGSTEWHWNYSKVLFSRNTVH